MCEVGDRLAGYQRLRPGSRGPRLAPHQNAGELLTTAPGVYIAQPEGEAVAHQIFLRGFDAEHGQDIELTVGGVPINQPSHIHGQGYADLNFIIPEVVRSLRVTEGVYDPRQGDFAVAGSIDFDLGVRRARLPARAPATARSTPSASRCCGRRAARPRRPSARRYVRAATASARTAARSSRQRDGAVRLRLPPDVRGLLHVAGLRRRAPGSPACCAATTSTPGASASTTPIPTRRRNAQSALRARAQACAATLDAATSDGARTSLALWLRLHRLPAARELHRLLERSQRQPEWVGRGDLIEQGNRDDMGVGAARFAPHAALRARPSWLAGTFELGRDLRHDIVEQAQNLLQPPQNETWDRRVDAAIRGDRHRRLRRPRPALHALPAPARRRARRRPLLRRRRSARELHRRASTRQTHLVGFRRTAIGVAAGPRVTLEVESARAGSSSRRPTARATARRRRACSRRARTAPFAKVRSAEGGVRAKPPAGRSPAGSRRRLSRPSCQRDLAFDPGEARWSGSARPAARGAPSRVDARPLPWLAARVASPTSTRRSTRRRRHRRGTRRRPIPGQLLPYVPPHRLSRRRSASSGRLGRSGGLGGRGRLGSACRAAARPLPYGEASPAIATLDLRASSVAWFTSSASKSDEHHQPRYAASEYAFVSDWGKQRTRRTCRRATSRPARPSRRCQRSLHSRRAL